MSEQPYNGDLALGICYGPSGAGKTTDLLYSFPRALFIAAPGALKPAWNVVGHVPANVYVETIDEATLLIEQHGQSGQFDSIVVDDFSLMAEKTFNILEATAGKDAFSKWNIFKSKLIHFRDTARLARMHIMVSMHEAPPKTKDGITYRGGPLVPGAKNVDALPNLFDIVVRTGSDSTRVGWTGVYRCGGPRDLTYVTKDRHGTTPDPAPMNMGEILRNAGYTIQRADGLEWQEDVIESIVPLLEPLPGGPAFAAKAKTILAGAAKELETQGVNPLHIRWALRDAVDRTILRRHKKNVLSMFTESAATGPGAK